MPPSRLKANPRDFLAVPRRSGATPNPAGTHALFALFSYDFQAHHNNESVHVLDLHTGSTHLLSQEPSGHTWTCFGSDVIWQKRVNGLTEFWIDDAATPGQTPYQAGHIEASITFIKVTRLSASAFGIVALGPETGFTESIKYSTGREYSCLPVCAFSGRPPVSKVLWYLRFDADQSQSELRFALSWKNVDILKGTGLEFVLYSGVVPMGPTNCDISSYGFVFSGRTHEQSTYTHRHAWMSNLFFIPMAQLQSPKEGAHILPQEIPVEEISGSVSFPIISTTGTIAFLKNEDKAKLTSQNHVFIVDISAGGKPKEILLHSDAGKLDSWPLNPEFLTWSNEKSKLLVSAADKGRQRIFEISIHTLRTGNFTNVPIPLDVGPGSVSSVYRFAYPSSDHRLLVSKTTFVTSSVFLVVDPTSNNPKTLSALTDGRDLGIHRGQISEAWFKGHGEYQVHTWIIKPSYFQEGDKYPLALLIHGGPHSSWQDVWSTRWNPMIFAEQGYIVVCPDTTGSIGYNEAFKEAATHEMAGRPYLDLQHCFQYIEQHVPYADTTNAVALGGSYGGYLIYWLAGQPFAQKFKALVAHAGMFNLPSLYATDVPDIWEVLFAGYNNHNDPSQTIKNMGKWDPIQFAHLWKTPILITHGELDRRCPHSMGLTAFTMAQMRGVESKFLSFEDEGHFIVKPENSLVWYRTVIEWMDKWTGKGNRGVVAE